MDRTGNSYVFISYKREDELVANKIVERLEGLGIRCWIDKRDIPGGATWDEELEEVQYRAAAVIWLKSPKSALSDQVLRELKQAREFDQLTIPLEIASVTVWGTEFQWKRFAKLQAFSLDDPAWADRVADQIFNLPDFVPLGEIATGDDSGPRAPAQSRGTPKPAGTSAVATTGGDDQFDAVSPFAIVSNDGRLYQLDALSGLGESLVDDDDPFTTGDLGIVAVSADGSVIATSSAAGEVDLWTLGAADAIRGPVLAAVLPATARAPRMLAVDRPLGQTIRVIAGGGNSAYSLTQRMNGTWTAMSLIDGDEPIVSSTVVKDDVLFVWAGGATAWATSRSKRPFSLPKVRGVDAAVGADGRCYLAGWGSGSDGSSLVEVVVEADSGWERIHRAAGGRAGIVRVMQDIVRQKPGATQTTVAVEQDDHSVAILPLS